jgi:hypothetical protein
MVEEAGSLIINGIIIICVSAEIVNNLCYTYYQDEEYNK